MTTAISEHQIHPAASLTSENPVEPNEVRNFSFYRQAVAKNLKPDVFKPNPFRLFWVGACLLLGFAAFTGIAFFDFAWPLKMLLGLLIGFSTGTLGFLAHEISHGSVIKNPRLQHLLAFFTLLPFFISPTFWKFAHNRLHHGKTQKLIEDPDAFPNLRVYRNSKFMRFMFPFTPGSRHKRSLAYFGFWLSFHYFVSQVYLRFRNRTFDSMNHRLVTIEFTAQLIIAAAFLFIAGPTNWLWVFVLPIVVQNYMLMSYIATNHNLSPLTSENNPLVNSLTVTNHPVFEFFTMNFGYHVEHHLFPTVNGKRVKAIHRELMSQFPDDYKVMPKWQAIRMLYSTARIYKNANQLVHPDTTDIFPTI